MPQSPDLGTLPTRPSCESRVALSQEKAFRCRPDAKRAESNPENDIPDDAERRESIGRQDPAGCREEPHGPERGGSSCQQQAKPESDFVTRYVRHAETSIPSSPQSSSGGESLGFGPGPESEITYSSQPRIESDVHEPESESPDH